MTPEVVPEITMWQTILMENTPLVLILFGIGGIALAKMASTIIKQKETAEKTAISNLVEKMDGLIEQIKSLVERHDSHERRIDALEKKQQAQYTRCNEREKYLNAMFKGHPREREYREHMSRIDREKTE